MEEIINVPMLVQRFEEVITGGRIGEVIREIILQSRVEFNVEEEGSEGLAFEKAISETEGHDEDEGLP